MVLIIPGGTTAAFPTVTAEALERHRFGGRNKSLLVSCVGDGGEAVVCVTKFRPLLESAQNALWCEWVAGLIGDKLGVRVPARYVVEVSPTLAPSIANSVGMPARASEFAGPHLGTEYLRHTAVVRDEESALEENLREAAARIAAFDAFIDNPDRMKTNPNCLLEASEGSHLVAIDHDMAFGGLFMHILGKSAWPNDILSTHLFKGRFGTKTPELGEVKAALLDLTDAFLDELPAKVPPLWLDGVAGSNLAKVIGALKQRRNTIDDWFPELESWVRT